MRDWRGGFREEKREIVLRKHLALIKRGSMDKLDFAACFDWALQRKLMLFIFELQVAS